MLERAGPQGQCGVRGVGAHRNRWRVAAIDATTNRVAAERLDDRARVVFEGGIGGVRQPRVRGRGPFTPRRDRYTSHAVLGENTSRATFYVAMTRGSAEQRCAPLPRSTGDLATMDGGTCASRVDESR